MNIIFLTLSNIESIESKGIYPDLLRKFRNEGHNVYIVKPLERRIGLATSVWDDDGVRFLGVKVLNIQKTNIIEKGLGTILLEFQYRYAIKRFLGDIVFDLILYSTPPITLLGAIKYLKTRNPYSISYLLLKDIFPQNAVDIQMISKNSIIYKLFRKKEIQLYRISDYIGCMSPANVEYILKHNVFINPKTVEVAPNSIELNQQNQVNRSMLRNKYKLPNDKMIFIYGGNLGKPQGVDFIINCLRTNMTREDCHFLIVGNGTEYHKLQKWVSENAPSNVSLYPGLPKSEYDSLVQICDVGLIFLDYRFTIPNFPSRLLTYLEFRMPVVVASDPNTDIGYIVEKYGFGKKCFSNDVDSFSAILDYYISNSDIVKTHGDAGYKYLTDNYLVENTYNTIIKHF